MTVVHLDHYSKWITGRIDLGPKVFEPCQKISIWVEGWRCTLIISKIAAYAVCQYTEDRHFKAIFNVCWLIWFYIIFLFEYAFLFLIVSDSKSSLAEVKHRTSIRAPRKAFDIYESGMLKKIPSNVWLRWWCLCNVNRCTFPLYQVASENVSDYIAKCWAELPQTEKAAYIERWEFRILIYTRRIYHDGWQRQRAMRWVAGWLLWCFIFTTSLMCSAIELYDRHSRHCRFYMPSRCFVNSFFSSLQPNKRSSPLRPRDDRVSSNASQHNCSSIDGQEGLIDGHLAFIILLWLSNSMLIYAHSKNRIMFS